MNSSLQEVEGNKVKLSITIDESEFDRDIDRAFRKIAKEVRLPGFRAGKVPRRVLEARIGLAPAREQALNDAIPQYLAKAVREHDVDVIDTSEVEITSGREEGPVAFDATLEVRPEVSVPGYGGLRVELPAIAVTDEEVDAEVDTELKRFGTLSDVDRPAAVGDYVVVDLAATRDGEPVPGLNADDWSYEIGQGWVSDDFDEQLVGVVAGRRALVLDDPEGHHGADRRDDQGVEGPGARGSRAHRRVGGREPRRVRHRRRVDRQPSAAASPTPSCTAPGAS